MPVIGLVPTTSLAAIAGLGVALLPTWVGDRGVHAGTLVAILPKFSTEHSLHVLTPGGRHIARRIAIVGDLLIATVGVQCTKHAAN